MADIDNSYIVVRSGELEGAYRLIEALRAENARLRERCRILSNAVIKTAIDITEQVELCP